MKKILTMFAAILLLAGCAAGTEEPLKDNAEITPSEEPSAGLKERYLAKLNDVEKGLEEFDQVFEHGTQIELTEAQGEVFARWDKALNEIYAELKKQLSSNDMNKLREEQRDWLEHRDEKAAEAALEFEGGSMENLQYVSIQAQLTKERCYELVELYMK
ncbi:lysozyme inhibitor LprI family protein [Solibacillus silvestris]|uniref:lysozyme inhibitor LprI family protein n=1 Tax=Solibacillus silvestris TaxID=76853 RepID=UPI003F81FF27